MNLTAVDGGIVRLRTKGAANPRTLYDCLNGFVTAARTVRVRPGTARVAQLPAGTKGLTAFDGALHVFAAESLTVPAGFVLHVLSHPDADDDQIIALKEIHFAEPYLGFLYVVAEFVDASVYHFWLQSGGAWQANRVYRHGDIVEPTAANGIAYQATRLGSAHPSWAPGRPRSIGDVIEPTTFNNYYYTVVETIGANPISGATEPDWPQESGARVFEDTEGITDEEAGATEPPSTNVPTSEVSDRYLF